MMTNVGIYEFNPKDLIGHGAFAVVYKGRLKSVSSTFRPFSSLSLSMLSGEGVEGWQAQVNFLTAERLVRLRQARGTIS